MWKWFCELNEDAQWRVLIWFNSEYDAYGVNGTGEYAPVDSLDEMECIADTNGWRFTDDGYWLGGRE